MHPRVEWLNYLYLMSESGHHRDVLLHLLDSSHRECIEYGGGSNITGGNSMFLVRRQCGYDACHEQNTCLSSQLSLDVYYGTVS